jgi:hypothetical protein
MKPFSDRFEAGRFLAPKLAHFRERPGAMVLALAKGGVPVAYEIAKDLHIATDLILYILVSMYSFGAQPKLFSERKRMSSSRSVNTLTNMPFNIIQPGLSLDSRTAIYRSVLHTFDGFERQVPAEQPAPKVIRLSAERLSRPLVESGFLSAFSTNMGQIRCEDQGARCKS